MRGEYKMILDKVLFNNKTFELGKQNFHHKLPAEFHFERPRIFDFVIRN